MNRLKNWANHHPIEYAYCWTLATVASLSLLNIRGLLENFLLALLGGIWICAESLAQLSAKKRAIDIPNNDYRDQISFRVTLYLNDALFMLLAYNHLTGGNFFQGIIFVIIVICSFVPFNYQDDEYQKMLQEKLQLAKNKVSNTPPLSKNYVKSKAAGGNYQTGNKEKHGSFTTSRNKPIKKKSNLKHPRPDSQTKKYNIYVSGTKYYELKKAVNYARQNDLFFTKYDDLTVAEIKEDMYTDEDPIYETDMSDVIDKITLQPEPNNKYDSKAIKVILHIDEQSFMIGYISKNGLNTVWRLLEQYKLKLVTLNITGYMNGGKYKAVDLDDHIHTGESPYNFNLVVTAVRTKFAETPKGQEVAASVKNTQSRKAMKPLTIHRLRKPLISYVVVDIETTGLYAPFDKVIQLSAVKYLNDEKTDCFNSYINPGVEKLPLSKFTTNLTGIKTQDVQDSPTLDEVKDKFIKFVGNLPWVGHNIFKFDIPFLYDSGIGISEYNAEDTYVIAKKYLDRSILGNLKLPTVKEYYGITEPSHNALADCITTALVYQRLRDLHLTNFLNEKGNYPSLKGIHFLVIGSFPELNHDNIVHQIELRGGLIDSRWTKRTRYLINGITNKSYKSVQNAKNNGVEFLDFPNFVSLLNQKDEQFSR